MDIETIGILDRLNQENKREKMVDIDTIKKDIVDNLSNINANKIILFGSYAYGTPNQNSDIDICIVKDKITSKLKEKRKIRELLKNIRIPKDIIVVDEEYYQTHSDQNWLNTALYEARHKGEILYEKK